MMLIAIDPDLFVSSLTNNQSKRTIEWLVQHMADLEFAIDRTKELRREYMTFLEQNVNQKNDLAVVLVDELLNAGRSATVALLSASRTHALDIEIAHHRCDRPVEPTLIGMCANAPKLGLTLLLTDPSVCERTRGLHNNDARQTFRELLPKLRVEYASPDIRMRGLEAEEKIDKDLWFEDKAKIIVNQVFGGKSRQNTPAPVQSALDGGDVDVYVWLDNDTQRNVWIGECKLQRFKDAHQVPLKKVKQLKVRLPIVTEYERTKISADKEVRVNSIVISNARDMEPEAWELAHAIGAVFWHIELSEDWKDKQQWYIAKVTEYAPKPPTEGENSQWSRRLVREIPVE